jgi:erythromycin esterase
LHSCIGALARLFAVDRVTVAERLLSRSRLAAACIAAAISVAAAFAQQAGPAEPFVAWAAEHAIRMQTIEPGRSSADLKPLKAVIGRARVVALGESSHGIHEFLAFRNRLFEFLVLELDFTALAVETGFAESIQVNDFINGGPGDSKTAAQNVFSYAPVAFDENRELIEWMRRYNAGVAAARKVRFYGIDITAGGQDQFAECRRALQAALAYVDRVDPGLARQFRGAVEPLLARFSERDYSTLTPAERNALTAATADLVSVFERLRLDFHAATGVPEYESAYRLSVVARQADAYVRASPHTPDAGKAPDSRDAEMGRNAAMADNVRWVLEREGSGGRVLVYAHNWHVKKAAAQKETYPEFFPDLPVTSMGQYLQATLKDAMVVVGCAFERGDEALHLAPVDLNGLDGTLSQVGMAPFALDLRAAPKAGPVATWLDRGRRVRVNDRYGELNPLAAFDALVFVEGVSRVHVTP